MPASVDDYIAGFPPATAALLEAIRRTIHEAAPGASEGLKYGMPTFFMDGAYIVYLAGWKKHIALYPIPSGSPAFEKAVAPWRDEKSTLRFPLDRPVPHALIKRVVRARLKELAPT
jgi:uncharacterized protein YdhG (YjbR/CyaY superfamily)